MSLLQLIKNHSAYASCRKYELTAANITLGIKLTIVANVTASIFITVSSVLFNSLVLLCFYRNQYLRTPVNLLILFLALTDWLTGAVVLPINIALRVQDYLTTTSCTLDVIFKAMSHGLAGLSAFAIVLISIDPFVSLSRRFMYGKKTQRLKNIYKILFAGSFIIVFVLSLLWIKETLNEKQTRYLVGILIGCWILFLAVAYSRVLCFIKMSARTEDSSVSQGITQRHRQRQQRCMKTVTLLFIVFIVCYLPRMIFAVTFPLYENDIITVYHTKRWSALFTFLNSAIDPLIYFCRIQKVRAAALQVLKKLKGNSKSQVEEIVLRRKRNRTESVKE